MNKFFMNCKLTHKASNHNTKLCEVEKWVFLPHSDFERLKANPYGELTEYGVLSGRGQKLYTTLTAEPETMEEAEKLTEDEAEAEDESEEISMGGIS